MQKIKVIVIQQSTKIVKGIKILAPEVQIKEINNDYDTFSNLVDGYLELPYITQDLLDNGIDFICNDHFRFQENLQPTLFFEKNKTINDYIMGTCFFTAHNNKGENISLTDDQISFILKKIKYGNIIYWENEKQYYFQGPVIELS